MGKINNKNEKTVEARRRAKKEAERRRRERIRNDPQLYEDAKQKERERYHKRKHQGKIKSVKDISVRSQRAKRKTWRDAAKKYRETKKTDNNMIKMMEADSPPPTPDHNVDWNDAVDESREPRGPCTSTSPKGRSISTRKSNSNTNDHEAMNIILESSGSSRKLSGRKKVRRDRAAAYRKIKKLELELKNYKSKYNKYKSKYFREINKKNPNNKSPNTKVKSLTKGLQIPRTLKRKLIFNEALISQMQHNYKKICSKKVQRQNFLKCIAGKIVKKYKCMNVVKKTFSLKVLRNKNASVNSKATLNMEMIKKEIEKFLEDDSSSTLCPGKKDTITFKKCKKQKRYFNDSLKNLHKVFCSNFTQFHISYSTFCKLRPFWIVQRKVFQRDTCLCMLHENMKFMVSRLKHLRIISESTSKEVLESLCCSDSLDINKCLERRCSDCKGKEIKFLDFSKEDTVSLNKWVLKKESYVIKGKTKISQKYTRDIIKCSIEELVEELKHQMPKFMSHVSNIIHQQGVIKHKKDELKPNEAIIHIDFSENYECKYYEEIQAFHFGGSREQVSIHTVMLYYKNEVTGPTLTKAFCTLSNSLNHDANAVCAHLRPVLEKVLHVLPHLRTIYFVSDGPNNQYRNRKMFYLIATYLPSILPSIEVISWNYTEAGHGKGAPDGLGGTLKRTADTLVAQGKDIQSFDHLIAELQNSVEKIDIISIPRSEIQSFGETVEDKSVTFKGTMKVHQVIWRRTDPKSLNFRRLSCFKCPPHECCHYGMGTQKLSNEPSTPGTKPCILFK